jgi:hypothetical protein
MTWCKFSEPRAHAQVEHVTDAGPVPRSAQKSKYTASKMTS